MMEDSVHITLHVRVTPVSLSQNRASPPCDIYLELPVIYDLMYHNFSLSTLLVFCQAAIVMVVLQLLQL